MAKKNKFTAEQIEIALKETGGFTTIAAKRLGCTYQTVCNYINRYKTLKKIKEELEENYIDLAENKLIKAVNEGNLTAIIFYLKCKGKNRGYIERHELTGKDGGPITQKQLPTLDLSSLSDDELALAEKLGLRAAGNGTGSDTG